MTQSPGPTCPACREQTRPTSFKEVRGGTGEVVKRIPLSYDCPSQCLRRLTPVEWGEAVARFGREQRDQG
ncbi:MAG TPA: hypothetical protein VFV01_11460 [Spirillospora sp.]|nr:hypothetical protein [Spirillospora sp.]